MKLLLACFVLLYSLNLNAQPHFGDLCVGEWKGTLYMYNQGLLKDSVPIKLSVTKTESPTIWAWKTEYFSPIHPLIKDYTLKLKDAKKQLYITDEGNGIELHDYRFGNKLYSVFEVDNTLLTTTYELLDGQLVFEVTSGKPSQPETGGVSNYSVDFLQRAVLKKD